MPNISIRHFQGRDIAFAYGMIQMEQWNITKGDLERMLEYEPDGCFVAEVNGNPAGHVFTVNYGRLGWIGLLIVKAEYRGIGIGTLLMEKAKQYLLNHGVATIKLEAEPAISRLYRDLGFLSEYDSLRLKGVCSQMPLQTNHDFKSMKRDMLMNVAEFDAQYFGANRTKVLRKLQEAYPKLCLVSFSKSKINGYIMCRAAAMGYNVGPWVCALDKTEVAANLLIACLHQVNPEMPFRVGVPAPNKEAIRILNELGFKQCSKTVRMRFGEELKNECIKGIFAIGGAMKG